MTGRRVRDRKSALAGALALALAAALAAAAGDARGAADDPEALRQQVDLGPVRVTLEADRQTMPIDGRLRLTLRVAAPAGTVVTLPAVADRLGPFVVASQSAEASSGDAAEVGQWRRDYVLEAEAAGRLSVPALTIAFRQADDGQTHELATEPVAITVTSVLPAEVDLTDFKDIAPPVELAPAGRPWLAWLIAVPALALAWLGLRRWRRRRRAGMAPPPPQPAHLLALAELDRLERQLAADRPGTEEVYVRLADILRRYLDWGFGLGAPTRTTEELLAALERTGGPIAARRQLIGRVLGTCDLVKFARERPAPATVHGSLRQARALIVQTAGPQAVVGPAPARAA